MTLPLDPNKKKSNNNGNQFWGAEVQKPLYTNVNLENTKKSLIDKTNVSIIQKATNNNKLLSTISQATPLNQSSKNKLRTGNKLTDALINAPKPLDLLQTTSKAKPTFSDYLKKVSGPHTIIPKLPSIRLAEEGLNVASDVLTAFHNLYKDVVGSDKPKHKYTSELFSYFTDDLSRINEKLPTLKKEDNLYKIEPPKLNADIKNEIKTINNIISGLYLYDPDKKVAYRNKKITYDDISKMYWQLDVLEKQYMPKYIINGYATEEYDMLYDKFKEAREILDNFWKLQMPQDATTNMTTQKDVIDLKDNGNAFANIVNELLRSVTKGVTAPVSLVTDNYYLNSLYTSFNNQYRQNQLILKYLSDQGLFDELDQISDKNIMSNIDQLIQKENPFKDIYDLAYGYALKANDKKMINRLTNEIADINEMLNYIYRYEKFQFFKRYEDALNAGQSFWYEALSGVGELGSFFADPVSIATGNIYAKAASKIGNTIKAISNINKIKNLKNVDKLLEETSLIKNVAGISDKEFDDIINLISRIKKRQGIRGLIQNLKELRYADDLNTLVSNVSNKAFYSGIGEWRDLADHLYKVDKVPVTIKDRLKYLVNSIGYDGIIVGSKVLNTKPDGLINSIGKLWLQAVIHEINSNGGYITKDNFDHTTKFMLLAGAANSIIGDRFAKIAKQIGLMKHLLMTSKTKDFKIGKDIDLFKLLHTSELMARMIAAPIEGAVASALQTTLMNEINSIEDNKYKFFALQFINDLFLSSMIGIRKFIMPPSLSKQYMDHYELLNELIDYNAKVKKAIDNYDEKGFAELWLSKTNIEAGGLPDVSYETYINKNNEVVLLPVDVSPVSIFEKFTKSINNEESTEYTVAEILDANPELRTYFEEELFKPLNVNEEDYKDIKIKASGRVDAQIELGEGEIAAYNEKDKTIYINSKTKSFEFLMAAHEMREAPDKYLVKHELAHAIINDKIRKGFKDKEQGLNNTNNALFVDKLISIANAIRTNLNKLDNHPQVIKSNLVYKFLWDITNGNLSGFHEISELGSLLMTKNEVREEILRLAAMDDFDLMKLNELTKYEKEYREKFESIKRIQEEDLKALTEAEKARAEERKFNELRKIEAMKRLEIDRIKHLLPEPLYYALTEKSVLKTADYIAQEIGIKDINDIGTISDDEINSILKQIKTNIADTKTDVEEAIIFNLISTIKTADEKIKRAEYPGAYDMAILEKALLENLLFSSLKKYVIDKVTQKVKDIIPEIPVIEKQPEAEQVIVEAVKGESIEPKEIPLLDSEPKLVQIEEPVKDIIEENNIIKNEREITEAINEKIVNNEIAKENINNTDYIPAKVEPLTTDDINNIIINRLDELAIQPDKTEINNIEEQLLKQVVNDPDKLKKTKDLLNSFDEFLKNDVYNNLEDFDPDEPIFFSSILARNEREKKILKINQYDSRLIERIHNIYEQFKNVLAPIGTEEEYSEYIHARLRNKEYKNITYHGTSRIKQRYDEITFSKKYFYTGEGAMIHGSGFYFTDEFPTAVKYSYKSWDRNYERLFQESVSYGIKKQQLTKKGNLSEYEQKLLNEYTQKLKEINDSMNSIKTYVVNAIIDTKNPLVFKTTQLLLITNFLKTTLQKFINNILDNYENKYAKLLDQKYNEIKQSPEFKSIKEEKIKGINIIKNEFNKIKNDAEKHYKEYKDEIFRELEEIFRLISFPEELIVDQSKIELKQEDEESIYNSLMYRIRTINEANNLNYQPSTKDVMELIRAIGTLNDDIHQRYLNNGDITIRYPENNPIIKFLEQHNQLYPFIKSFIRLPYLLKTDKKYSNLNYSVDREYVQNLHKMRNSLATLFYNDIYNAVKDGLKEFNKINEEDIDNTYVTIHQMFSSQMWMEELANTLLNNIITTFSARDYDGRYLMKDILSNTLLYEMYKDKEKTIDVLKDFIDQAIGNKEFDDKGIDSEWTEYPKFYLEFLNTDIFDKGIELDLNPLYEFEDSLLEIQKRETSTESYENVTLLNKAILDSVAPYLMTDIAKINGFDSFIHITEGGFGHKKGERHIVVFEPEQIHILGTPEDAKHFDTWKKLNKPDYYLSSVLVDNTKAKVFKDDKNNNYIYANREGDKVYLYDITNNKKVKVNYDKFKTFKYAGILPKISYKDKLYYINKQKDKYIIYDNKFNEIEPDNTIYKQVQIQYELNKDLINKVNKGEAYNINEEKSAWDQDILDYLNKYTIDDNKVEDKYKKYHSINKDLEEIKPKNINEYTREQKFALIKAINLINNGINDIRIAGFAGTGKSLILVTLFKYLRKQGNSVNIIAPTNTAVRNVFNKYKESYGDNDIVSSTFHSTYAYYKGEKEIEEGIFEPSFKYKDEYNKEFFPADVVLVDEAPFISGEDIKHVTGKVRVYFGDPFQLRYGKEGSSEEVVYNDILDEPDVILTNVQRNKNEVYEVTNLMRKTNAVIIPVDAENIKIIDSRSKDDRMGIIIDEYVDSIVNNRNGILITWKHKDRIDANERIKEKLDELEEQGLYGSNRRVFVINTPKALKKDYRNSIIEIDKNTKVEFGERLFGEEPKLIVYKNNEPYEAEIYRKRIGDKEYYVVNILKLNKPILGTNDVNDVIQRVKRYGIKNANVNNTLITVDGYAITAHKSQGLEYDEVYIGYTDSPLGFPDAINWYYTAITRSKNKVFILNDNYYKVKMSNITQLNKLAEGVIEPIKEEEIDIYEEAIKGEPIQQVEQIAKPIKEEPKSNIEIEKEQIIKDILSEAEKEINKDITTDEVKHEVNEIIKEVNKPEPEIPIDENKPIVKPTTKVLDNRKELINKIDDIIDEETEVDEVLNINSLITESVINEIKALQEVFDNADEYFEYLYNYVDKTFKEFNLTKEEKIKLVILLHNKAAYDLYSVTLETDTGRVQLTKKQIDNSVSKNMFIKPYPHNLKETIKRIKQYISNLFSKFDKPLFKKIEQFASMMHEVFDNPHLESIYEITGISEGHLTNYGNNFDDRYISTLRSGLIRNGRYLLPKTIGVNSVMLKLGSKHLRFLTGFKNPLLSMIYYNHYTLIKLLTSDKYTDPIRKNEIATVLNEINLNKLLSIILKKQNEPIQLQELAPIFYNEEKFNEIVDRNREALDIIVNTYKNFYKDFSIERLILNEDNLSNSDYVDVAKKLFYNLLDYEITIGSHEDKDVMIEVDPEIAIDIITNFISEDKIDTIIGNMLLDNLLTRIGEGLPSELLTDKPKKSAIKYLNIFISNKSKYFINDNMFFDINNIDKADTKELNSMNLEYVNGKLKSKILVLNINPAIIDKLPDQLKKMLHRFIDDKDDGSIIIFNNKFKERFFDKLAGRKSNVVKFDVYEQHDNGNTTIIKGMGSVPIFRDDPLNKLGNQINMLVPKHSSKGNNTLNYYTMDSSIIDNLVVYLDEDRNIIGGYWKDTQKPITEEELINIQIEYLKSIFLENRIPKEVIKHIDISGSFAPKIMFAPETNPKFKPINISFQLPFNLEYPSLGRAYEISEAMLKDYYEYYSNLLFALLNIRYNFTSKDFQNRYATDTEIEALKMLKNFIGESDDLIEYSNDGVTSDMIQTLLDGIIAREIPLSYLYIMPGIINDASYKTEPKLPFYSVLTRLIDGIIRNKVINAVTHKILPNQNVRDMLIRNYGKELINKLNNGEITKEQFNTLLDKYISLINEALDENGFIKEGTNFIIIPKSLFDEYNKQAKEQGLQPLTLFEDEGLNKILITKSPTQDMTVTALPFRIIGFHDEGHGIILPSDYVKRTDSDYDGDEFSLIFPDKINNKYYKELADSLEEFGFHNTKPDKLINDLSDPVKRKEILDKYNVNTYDISLKTYNKNTYLTYNAFYRSLAKNITNKKILTMLLMNSKEIITPSGQKIRYSKLKTYRNKKGQILHEYIIFRPDLEYTYDEIISAVTQNDINVYNIDNIPYDELFYKMVLNKTIVINEDVIKERDKNITPEDELINVLTQEMEKNNTLDNLDGTDIIKDFEKVVKNLRKYNDYFSLEEVRKDKSKFTYTLFKRIKSILNNNILDPMRSELFNNILERGREFATDIVTNKTYYPLIDEGFEKLPDVLSAVLRNKVMQTEFMPKIKVDNEKIKPFKSIINNVLNNYVYKVILYNQKIGNLFDVSILLEPLFNSDPAYDKTNTVFIQWLANNIVNTFGHQFKLKTSKGVYIVEIKNNVLQIFKPNPDPAKENKPIPVMDPTSDGKTPIKVGIMDLVEDIAIENGQPIFNNKLELLNNILKLVDEELELDPTSLFVELISYYANSKDSEQGNVFTKRNYSYLIANMLIALSKQYTKPILKDTPEEEKIQIYNDRINIIKYLLTSPITGSNIPYEYYDEQTKTYKKSYNKYNGNLLDFKLENPYYYYVNLIKNFVDTEKVNIENLKNAVKKSDIDNISKTMEFGEKLYQLSKLINPYSILFSLEKEGYDIKTEDGQNWKDIFYNKDSYNDYDDFPVFYSSVLSKAEKGNRSDIIKERYYIEKTINRYLNKEQRGVFKRFLDKGLVNIIDDDEIQSMMTNVIMPALENIINKNYGKKINIPKKELAIIKQKALETITDNIDIINNLPLILKAEYNNNKENSKLRKIASGTEMLSMLYNLAEIEHELKYPSGSKYNFIFSNSDVYKLFGSKSDKDILFRNSANKVVKFGHEDILKYNYTDYNGVEQTISIKVKDLLTPIYRIQSGIRFIPQQYVDYILPNDHFNDINKNIEAILINYKDAFLKIKNISIPHIKFLDNIFGQNILISINNKGNSIATIKLQDKTLSIDLNDTSNLNTIRELIDRILIENNVKDYEQYSLMFEPYIKIKMLNALIKNELNKQLGMIRALKNKYTSSKAKLLESIENNIMHLQNFVEHPFIGAELLTDYDISNTEYINNYLNNISKYVLALAYNTSNKKLKKLYEKNFEKIKDVVIPFKEFEEIPVKDRILFMKLYVTNKGNIDKIIDNIDTLELDNERKNNLYNAIIISKNIEETPEIKVLLDLIDTLSLTDRKATIFDLMNENILLALNNLLLKNYYYYKNDIINSGKHKIIFNDFKDIILSKEFDLSHQLIKNVILRNLTNKSPIIGTEIYRERIKSKLNGILFNFEQIMRELYLENPDPNKKAHITTLGMLNKYNQNNYVYTESIDTKAINKLADRDYGIFTDNKIINSGDYVSITMTNLVNRKVNAKGRVLGYIRLKEGVDEPFYKNYIVIMDDTITNNKSKQDYGIYIIDLSMIETMQKAQLPGLTGKLFMKGTYHKTYKQYAEDLLSDIYESYEGMVSDSYKSYIDENNKAILKIDDEVKKKVFTKLYNLMEALNRNVAEYYYTGGKHKIRAQIGIAMMLTGLPIGLLEPLTGSGMVVGGAINTIVGAMGIFTNYYKRLMQNKFSMLYFPAFKTNPLPGDTRIDEIKSMWQEQSNKSIEDYKNILQLMNEITLGKSLSEDDKINIAYFAKDYYKYLKAVHTYLSELKKFINKKSSNVADIEKFQQSRKMAKLRKKIIDLNTKILTQKEIDDINFKISNMAIIKDDKVYGNTLNIDGKTIEDIEKELEVINDSLGLYNKLVSGIVESESQSYNAALNYINNYLKKFENEFGDTGQLLSDALKNEIIEYALALSVGEYNRKTIDQKTPLAKLIMKFAYFGLPKFNDSLGTLQRKKLINDLIIEYSKSQLNDRDFYIAQRILPINEFMVLGRDEASNLQKAVAGYIVAKYIANGGMKFLLGSVILGTSLAMSNALYNSSSNISQLLSENINDVLSIGSTVQHMVGETLMFLSSLILHLLYEDDEELPTQAKNIIRDNVNLFSNYGHGIGMGTILSTAKLGINYGLDLYGDDEEKLKKELYRTGEMWLTWNKDFIKGYLYGVNLYENYQKANE